MDTCFRFKPGVLDVFDEQIEAGVPRAHLAKKVGVNQSSFHAILNGGSMALKTTVKFIKYFQKYHGWSEDEWQDKLIEIKKEGCHLSKWSR